MPINYIVWQTGLIPNFGPLPQPQPQELWFLPSEIKHGSAYYFVALFSVISLLVEFLEIHNSQASY